MTQKTLGSQPTSFITVLVREGEREKERTGRRMRERGVRGGGRRRKEEGGQYPSPLSVRKG